MKKFILLFTFLVIGLLGFGQTTLTSGDIAILEMNADDSDNFAFIVLTDITSGTDVKFTDNGWKSDNTWRTGEGVITWSTTSIVNCGTIVHINNISSGTISATSGTTVKTSGSFNISGSGDQIIAYQGTSTMIAALNTDGTNWGTSATSTKNSALPQGLVDGSTCGHMNSSDSDNNKYLLASISDTKLNIRSSIYNPINWSKSESVIQDYTGLIVVTDCGGGSSPTITTSTATLTGFGYTVGSVTSSEQSFNIEGANLTADISIAAPTNYEISETTGGAFSATNPITLTQAGGVVAQTNIYVRLKAGLSPGDYNSEDITASSTDAADKTVMCSGTVTSPEVPTVFTATASSNSQIDLSWTKNGNDNNVIIVFDEDNSFTAPTDGVTYSGSALGGTIIYNANGTTFNHTTLSASTQYYYQAYSVDANDNYSALVSDNATTLEPLITQSETALSSFNYLVGNGPSVEQNFTVEGSNLTSDIIITPPTNYEISTGTGGSFVATNPITLTQSGGDVASTTIYARLKSGLNAGDYNSEDITASSTDATSGTVTCSGAVTTPPSPEPSNHATSFAVTSASTTNSSITLTWSDASVSQLPDRYLIKAAVDPTTPAAPSDGNAESDATLVKNITQGTESVVFTGLSTGTTYNFSIWPYTNSGSSIDYKTSGTVPNASETTTVSYCTSNGNTSYGTAITKVQLNSINNTTLVKNNAYEDYTAQSTDLEISSNYILTVNLETDGTYDIYSMVWIDWNHDGNFGDASEEYILGSAYDVSNGATSNSPLSITVPTAATLGSTRMRVSAKYGSNATSCETGYDGEVEDYTINVVAQVIKPEPTNQVINLLAAEDGTDNVDIIWDDNDGTQAADGFVLIANTTNSFTAPVDGTDPTEDSDLSDGSALVKISNGIESHSFSSLDDNTTYYFKIWPYTNSGAVLDFKTDGTVPSGSATTEAVIVAPTATSATSIAKESFTANWDAVSGASGYKIDIYSETAGINASDLFISEYIDGDDGTNKAIEIYNGTGAPVDLSNYKIWTISNGGSWPENTIALTGTLANEEVYVITNASTFSNLTIESDLSSGSLSFNGDDAIGLAKNISGTLTLIDAVGTNGSDPGTGWAVAGVTNATPNRVLTRKSSVNAPNTDWDASRGTNSTDSEWIVQSGGLNDDAAGFGSHSYSGGSSITYVLQDADAVLTSYDIYSLSSGTNYSYVVRAITSTQTSSNSNIISIKTKPDAASSLTIVEGTNTAIISWIRGNGDGVLVKISDATLTVASRPVDGTDYLSSCNTTYSGSGEQWVYDETGTTTTITLPQGYDIDKLNVAIFEYSAFDDGLAKGTTKLYDLGKVLPYGAEEGTLPIDLISFSAKANTNSVNLNWETASEENNDYFTIERSYNAIDFEEIARVKAAGNSNKIIYYEHADLDVNMNSTIYYRLMQTDFDGEFTKSEIISVNSKSEKFSLINSYGYEGNIYLNMNSDINTNALIEVFDVSGRVLFSNDIILQEGINSYKINMPNYASGLYFIRIANEKQQQVINAKLILK